MFHVKTSRGLPGELSTVELMDDRGSRAVIVPERGGIVAAFEVAGQSVLYLEEDTLVDARKNVRGGIPILFPSPGRLSGDRFERDGHRGPMRQHGIARERAHDVASVDFRDRAAVTLTLAWDASMREAFPWPFRLQTTYALRGERLRIEQRLENVGEERLPYALGLHPYFRLPSAIKASARIPTDATRAWDNVRKEEVAVHGIALDAGEVDLHLVDHGSNAAELRWPGGRVRVQASAAFRRWVVWTLPDKDFVCLEPWTAPADALNLGVDLRHLPPRGVDEHFVEISFEAGASIRP